MDSIVQSIVTALSGKISKELIVFSCINGTVVGA